MPMVSTMSVPEKFCRIIQRQSRASWTVSTNFARLFPISIISVLSRATSVPAPMATATLASLSAGASLIPSPSLATVRPFVPAQRSRALRGRLNHQRRNLSGSRRIGGYYLPRQNRHIDLWNTSGHENQPRAGYFGTDTARKPPPVVRSQWLFHPSGTLGQQLVRKLTTLSDYFSLGLFKICL